MKATTPYEIQVEGTIGAQWDRRFFPGLDITFDQAAVTTIVAQIPDAAALRGLVNYLWDLNINIISLQRMQPKNDHDKKEESNEN
jgi:hypothetical protein